MSGRVSMALFICMGQGVENSRVGVKHGAEVG